MKPRETVAPSAMSPFLARVAEHSGQAVMSCYQCGNCTAGCPMAHTVGLGPRQVIRAVQLGLREAALGNELIWLCLGCQTCTVRCPREIDVAAVMETLRLLAIGEGMKPAIRDVAILHRLLLESVKRTGRVYELGVGGLYNLLGGRPLTNADLLPRLLAKGKLGLFPARDKGARKVNAVYERVAQIEARPVTEPIGGKAASRPGPRAPAPITRDAAVRSYAYYPGCSLGASAREYDVSTRLVFARLGVELRELEGWNCCGASSAHTTSKLLGHALPARNLQLAEEMGLPLTTPCPACFSRLQSTRHALRNSQLSGQVSEALGREFRNQVPVVPILGAIRAEEVAAAVRRPLAGLKVACYYGCLFVRPREVAQFDDEENPQTMDWLLAAAGAETIDWAFKTECCGASLRVPRPALAAQLTGRVLAAARRLGADCVAVACPMCQANLDQRQEGMAEALSERGAMPVLYFTQLLALALGLPPAELMFEKNLTDPLPMLRAKGFA
ncbi:MAG: heterodisulfide reductase-related iron-sulfur binding cluster [Dehalococcoidales bacterium]|nr:heterodisulfide reductase-related iron-sulfur binding cluster [Dehalococcoidales bacterium]